MSGFKARHGQYIAVKGDCIFCSPGVEMVPGFGKGEPGFDICRSGIAGPIGEGKVAEEDVTDLEPGLNVLVRV